jgi:DNA-binding transcriptional ArsR family regulator
MVQIRDGLYPDIASLASLIGDASRARILQALADGRALPASALARCAGVSAATVSSHLGKLVSSHLLKVVTQGRHRYYSLSSTRVAHILESLARLARLPPVLTPAQDARTKRLRFARSCYRHLAGHAGVAVAQALFSAQLLRETADGYEITDAGRAWLSHMSIDVEGLRGRPLARRCMDWSERRPHIGGPLGSALLERMLALRWLARSREPRVLRLTESGRRGLRRELSVRLDFS